MTSPTWKLKWMKSEKGRAEKMKYTVYVSPRRKRNQFSDDEDDDDDDMISIIKTREALTKKSLKKKAEIAAAEEMAQSIFEFSNPSSCTECTELKHELACSMYKLEVNDLKATLANKNT